MRYLPRNPNEYPAVRQYAPPGHIRRLSGLPPETPIFRENFHFSKIG